MPRSRGTPEHGRPSGERFPPHERFAQRLADARTFEQVEQIAREAHDALLAATKRPFGHRSYETVEERDERILADGEGWAAEDVADAMRCRAGAVRSARLARGRDPETGYSLPDGDPFLVALELRAQGRSTRVIESLTGIPRSTLRYRLGEP